MKKKPNRIIPICIILGAEELYTAAIQKNSKDFRLYNNRAQARINLKKVQCILV